MDTSTTPLRGSWMRIQPQSRRSQALACATLATVAPKAKFGSSVLPMTRINWDDLSSQVYEDIVAVLLARLFPESQRINGAGGDGGRDVQIRDGDRFVVFELKSFSGRLSPSRRAQVKASLRRAAQLDPSRWTLVVPIDPTPEELKWFEELGKTVPFPLEWKGETWLDGELLLRPEIGRYFIQGKEHEALELLRELTKEDAALEKGVPSALERTRKLSGTRQ